MEDSAMAKGIYMNIGSGIKKTKQIYVGVNGVVKKVKKVYVGVNGVPKLVWPSIDYNGNLITGDAIVDTVSTNGNMSRTAGVFKIDDNRFLQIMAERAPNQGSTNNVIVTAYARVVSYSNGNMTYGNLVQFASHSYNIYSTISPSNELAVALLGGGSNDPVFYKINNNTVRMICCTSGSFDNSSNTTSSNAKVYIVDFTINGTTVSVARSHTIPTSYGSVICAAHQVNTGLLFISLHPAMWFNNNTYYMTYNIYQVTSSSYSTITQNYQFLMDHSSYTYYYIWHRFTRSGERLLVVRNPSSDPNTINKLELYNVTSSGFSLISSQNISLPNTQNRPSSARSMFSADLDRFYWFSTNGNTSFYVLNYTNDVLTLSDITYVNLWTYDSPANYIDEDDFKILMLGRNGYNFLKAYGTIIEVLPATTPSLASSNSTKIYNVIFGSDILWVLTSSSSSNPGLRTQIVPSHFE